MENFRRATRLRIKETHLDTFESLAMETLKILWMAHNLTPCLLALNSDQDIIYFNVPVTILYT